MGMLHPGYGRVYIPGYIPGYTTLGTPVLLPPSPLYRRPLQRRMSPCDKSLGSEEEKPMGESLSGG